MIAMTVHSPDDLLRAIFDVQRRPHGRRTYLGGSSLARECPREQWLSWRWCLSPIADDNKTRVFSLGHLLEDHVASMILKVPSVNLHTEERGSQIGGSMFAGHVQYHVDGVLELPLLGGVYLWEAKSAKSTRFNKLVRISEAIAKERDSMSRVEIEDAPQRSAYSEWDSTYAGQVQFYMGALREQRHSKIESAWVTVYNKNTSEIYSELIPFRPTEYETIKESAAWILGLTAPPPAQWGASAYQVKNFMDAETRGVYLGQHPPLHPNCRNCRFSQPIVNDGDQGEWACRFHKKKLTIRNQKEACPDHQWIPELVGAERLPAGLSETAPASYKTPQGDIIQNVSESSGSHKRLAFTSHEIAFLARNDWDLGSAKTLSEIRTAFDASYDSDES